MVGDRFPLSRIGANVATVVPAKAGTHGNLLPSWAFWAAMDSRIRGNDAKPLATFDYVSAYAPARE